MNFEYLFDILLIPVCIQVGALIIGFLLNRLINRYLHSNINQGSWQYIFVNALRGLPISWCSGVGLYWTINSLDIPPTINKLLSYLLFAVIVFTLTRVVARTLSGIIDFYTMRSDQNMPKTSLLTNVINFVIYAMGVLIVLQYYGISVAPILTALGVGGMAAVLGVSFKDIDALVEACNDENHFCVAANDNSDGQVVLSGHIQAIEKAVEIASEFGAKRCLKLPVSAPFHSPLMQPAAETMARAFMEVQAENAQIPIVANVLAAPETEKKEIIKNLIEQVTGTVRWRETMSFFDADGVTDLVEIGAGKVLSGLAKRSLKNINSVSVCSVQEIEELAKNL